jgi:thiamine pyrophosphate-dependent acetolactate synthase large subunit-like protein
MSGFSNRPLTRGEAKVMGRFDLTQRLVAQLRHEEAVIGGIGNSNFDLWGAGRRPQNFYMLGSMGLAVPIALGVAIAQPQRRVVALEGDGSILMQLGSLATVANRNQTNLVIVILDNGAYQITGGQTTATGQGADIVAIARGAGITQSAWAADEAHYQEMVEQALAEPGPWLIAVRTDMQKPAVQTTRDPVQIRDRFMRGLGVLPEWGS